MRGNTVKLYAATVFRERTTGATTRGVAGGGDEGTTNTNYTRQALRLVGIFLARPTTGSSLTNRRCPLFKNARRLFFSGSKIRLETETKRKRRRDIVDQLRTARFIVHLYRHPVEPRFSDAPFGHYSSRTRQNSAPWSIHGEPESSEWTGEKRCAFPSSRVVTRVECYHTTAENSSWRPSADIETRQRPGRDDAHGRATTKTDKKHLSCKTLAWNTRSQKDRITRRVSSVFRYGAQCGTVLLYDVRRVCAVTVLFDRNLTRFNKFESTEYQKNERVVFKRNSVRIHDFHRVFISYTSHNLITKKYKLPPR